MAIKNINDMSVEELNAQMAQMQEVIANKLKLENIKAINDILETSMPNTVQNVLDYLNGKLVISEPIVKKEKKVKALKLVDGKVFFGTQEITQIKKDKSGALRIVKTGKGAPPTIADQSDEIKAILMTLPIIE